MSHLNNEHDQLLPETDLLWIVYAFATMSLQSSIFGVQNDENALEGIDMISISLRQRAAIQGLFRLLSAGTQIPPVGLFEVRQHEVVETEEFSGGFYQPVLTEHCRRVQRLRFRDPATGNIITGEERCRNYQCYMANLKHPVKADGSNEFSGHCYTGMHNEAVFIKDRNEVRAVFLMGQMRLVGENMADALRQHNIAMNQSVGASQAEKNAIRRAMTADDVPTLTHDELEALKNSLHQLGTMLIAITSEHDLLQYYAQISHSLLSKRLRDLSKSLEAIAMVAKHYQKLLEGHAERMPGDATPEALLKAVEASQNALNPLKSLLTMMDGLTEDYTPALGS